MANGFSRLYLQEVLGKAQTADEALHVSKLVLWTKTACPHLTLTLMLAMPPALGGQVFHTSCWTSAYWTAPLQGQWCKHSAMVQAICLTKFWALAGRPQGLQSEEGYYCKWRIECSWIREATSRLIGLWLACWRLTSSGRCATTHAASYSF